MSACSSTTSLSAPMGTSSQPCVASGGCFLEPHRSPAWPSRPSPSAVLHDAEQARRAKGAAEWPAVLVVATDQGIEISLQSLGQSRLAAPGGRASAIAPSPRARPCDKSGAGRTPRWRPAGPRRGGPARLSRTGHRAIGPGGSRTSVHAGSGEPSGFRGRSGTRKTVTAPGTTRFGWAGCRPMAACARAMAASGVCRAIVSKSSRVIARPTPLQLRRRPVPRLGERLRVRDPLGRHDVAGRESAELVNQRTPTRGCCQGFRPVPPPTIYANVVRVRYLRESVAGRVRPSPKRSRAPATSTTKTRSPGPYGVGRRPATQSGHRRARSSSA